MLLHNFLYVSKIHAQIVFLKSKVFSTWKKPDMYFPYFRCQWSIIRNCSSDRRFVHRLVDPPLPVLFYVQALHPIQMGKS